MAINKTSNFWILLLCTLAGLTVGNFIGELFDGVSFLKWVNYVGNFGLDQPLQINLGVIWISFQLKFKITLASIIGMIAGILVYQKIK